jgi:hypothetical protein
MIEHWQVTGICVRPVPDASTGPAFQITGSGVRPVLVRRLYPSDGARVSRAAESGRDGRVLSYRVGTSFALAVNLFATKAQAAAEFVRRRKLTHSATDRRCLRTVAAEAAA